LLFVVELSHSHIYRLFVFDLVSKNTNRLKRFISTINSSNYSKFFKILNCVSSFLLRCQSLACQIVCHSNHLLFNWIQCAKIFRAGDCSKNVLQHLSGKHHRQLLEGKLELQYFANVNEDES